VIFLLRRYIEPSNRWDLKALQILGLIRFALRPQDCLTPSLGCRVMALANIPILDYLE
jgi:hypothetical protein